MFQLLYLTVKFLNIRTPKKLVVITLKFELCGSNIRVRSPNDADGMANSVDPDQTAPAQTCLSENLGSLRYTGTCECMSE